MHNITITANNSRKIIKAIQPTGSYYLGGYSHGGSTSMEIGLQMQAAGDTMGLLFMLDSVYPDHSGTFSESQAATSLTSEMESASLLRKILVAETGPNLRFVMNETMRFSWKHDKWLREYYTHKFSGSLKCPTIHFRAGVRVRDPRFDASDRIGHGVIWARHAGFLKVIDVPANHEDIYNSKASLNVIVPNLWDFLQL